MLVLLCIVNREEVPKPLSASEAISTYLIGHYISSFYLTIDFSSFQIGLNINFLYKTGIIFLFF